MKRDEGANLVEMLKLDIPAVYLYLPLIGNFISLLMKHERCASTDEGVAYNIELAVHEACTNIIEHAYAGVPGRIDLCFKLFDAPSRFVIEIFDNGRSFDFDAVPSPNLDQPQIRGYGLFLIQELMDEVIYVSENGRNHWTISKQLT